MNLCILSGRLTADAEFIHTNEGKTVAKFNFAVNRRFKKEGDQEADFFTCVAFEKIAETLEKCAVSKGTKLLIEGEVRNNNYEKDGVKHYNTQVKVDSFEFCESKSSSNAPAETMNLDGMDFDVVDGTNDDLPF